MNKKILLLSGLGGVVIIGLGLAMAMSGKNKRTNTPSTDTQQITQMPPETMQQSPSASSSGGMARWDNTAEGGWLLVEGKAPDCPNPFTIKSPSDLSKATSMFPPGQERRGDFTGMGGNYKIHGGFRFDGLKPTDVKVVSPIDGYVYRGGNYLVGGELQYTFDIIHPCGMMVRLGHLRELSEPFKKMATAFPPAAEGDSRTERIQGYPEVKAGDPIASAVGFNKGPNVFFDLGVLDLRKKNAISQTADYQQKRADNKELAWHAVCWYDMLPIADATKIKSLPAGDPDSGKKSDYCAE